MPYIPRLATHASSEAIDVWSPDMFNPYTGAYNIGQTSPGNNIGVYTYGSNSTANRARFPTPAQFYINCYAGPYVSSSYAWSERVDLGYGYGGEIYETRYYLAIDMTNSGYVSALYLNGTEVESGGGSIPAAVNIETGSLMSGSTTIKIVDIAGIPYNYVFNIGTSSSGPVSVSLA